MDKQKLDWIKINEAIGKHTVCGQQLALNDYRNARRQELDGHFESILNETWPRPFIDDLIEFNETLIDELTDDDAEIMKLYQELNFNDTDDLRVMDARNDAMLYIMWNLCDDGSKAWQRYYKSPDGLNRFK